MFELFIVASYVAAFLLGMCAKRHGCQQYQSTVVAFEPRRARKAITRRTA